MRVLAAAVLFAVCLGAAPQKKESGKKPPDIQMVETTVRRNGENFTLDGRVHITSEKVLRGLVVVFDFFGPEGSVIATQKTEVSEDDLEPGKEASYQALAQASPRAVSYKLRAFDINERELRIANAGPFAIE
jgi:hypothetical protein